MFTTAQHWLDIGGLSDWPPRCMYEDTAEGVLYIAGGFFIAGNDTVAGITKWDGHQFHTLGCGLNWGRNPSTTLTTYGGWVNAMTKYNNEIYVTGSIVLAGNIHVNNIARWDGSKWDSVGHGLQWPGVALKVIDNELYVGGAFDSAGGIKVNSLAKWNGSQWSDVYNMPSFWDDSSTNYVFAVEKYKGELYVGGNFNNFTNSNDIVKYDGSNWVGVGGSILGSMNHIAAMTVYKDELYVAGAIYHNDGNVGNFIQRWDGSQWKDVGGGTTYNLFNSGSNGQIADMKVHYDELYITGVFNYAGGVAAQKIAKWNGTDWCGFGGTFDNNGSCLGFLHDTLYIGGGFHLIDGDNIKFVAKLAGGTTADTCSNYAGIDAESQAEDIYIFPTAATDFLFIESSLESEDATVILYNLQGQVCLCQPIITSHQKIDVSRLSRGIYLAKIVDEKVNKTFKIVKE
jgi:hypothetical protein